MPKTQSKKQPKVKSQNQQKTSAKLDDFHIDEMDDYNQKIIVKNFEKRAGTKNYQQELAERLKDVSDETLENVKYLLPIKLSKKGYKALLEGALILAKKIPNWNERDQVEALILFQDAKTLTCSQEEA